MFRRIRHVLPLVVMIGLLPAGALDAQGVECPTVEPPDISFDQPTYIDRERAGGEPVSVVGEDGSISVSAHAGTTHIYKNPEAAPGAGDFVVGYTNQTLHWRSVDGGRTWRYIGIAGLREGPHTATSTGFSDPDLTIDLGGRIYDTEIDLANVSVFSSVDDGQSYTFGTPEAASGDRPWLIGGEADEVYLYVNSPKTFWRSTDGGLTYSLLPTPPINAKGYRDPRNPTQGLIGPVGTNGIAISNNKGQSWTTYGGAGLGSNVDFFGSLAVDRDGNAYKLAAGGYNDNSSSGTGSVTYNYFDRDTLQWGSPRVTIAIPPGRALWPWLTAGDDGRVAVTWYHNPPGTNEFYIYMAYTHNGHGTTVECSDGSTQFVPPQFTVVNASGRPIHKGTICLGGTGCNADTNFEDGDRRLGDFFTINHDANGNVFIVSADTMLPNPVGGPKPVGNPIFIRQTGGDPILAQPDTVRKTRCLFPIPEGQC